MSKIKNFAVVFLCLFSISAFASQIKCGDYVVEDYQGRSIQKVLNISSDGLYQLEDGQWYHSDYIYRLISTYRGISIGQTVVEDYQGHSIQKVLNISSDGLYQLEDGQWYHSDYINRLDCGNSTSCN